MNPFDSYMLNKVRRLKDVRTRYAATGEKALLAGVPDAEIEFVTGIWPQSTPKSVIDQCKKRLAAYDAAIRGV